jgi:hypothetical protein
VILGLFQQRIEVILMLFFDSNLYDLRVVWTIYYGELESWFDSEFDGDWWMF